jgi:hypothetical protein
MVPMGLMLWLPSCAPEPPVSPPAALVVAPAAADRDTRRATILAQVRAICPQTMLPADLTRAADYLEAHPDALWLVGRLNLMDKQSHICRGDQP